VICDVWYVSVADISPLPSLLPSSLSPPLPHADTGATGGRSQVGDINAALDAEDEAALKARLEREEKQREEELEGLRKSVENTTELLATLDRTTGNSTARIRQLESELERLLSEGEVGTCVHVYVCMCTCACVCENANPSPLLPPPPHTHMSLSEQAMERDILIKRKTLEMLPSAAANIEKLQGICGASSAKLLQLAQEWEQHRRPLLDQIRTVQNTSGDRRAGCVEAYLCVFMCIYVYLCVFMCVCMCLVMCVCTCTPCVPRAMCVNLPHLLRTPSPADAKR